MANKSKINTTKLGQYILTMPKAIAQAMALKKGDFIEWIFDRGYVSVRKIE